MTDSDETEKMAKGICNKVMPAVRGSMMAAKVGYDKADKIAEGVYAGILQYVEGRWGD